MDEKFELPKIGDILMEEFLEPLEITPYRLAKDLGVSTSSILDLVHNKRKISVSGDFSIFLCGAAALQNKVQRVDDVHQFPGHIACDSASNAEIVIPIHKNGKLVGAVTHVLVNDPTRGYGIFIDNMLDAAA